MKLLILAGGKGTRLRSEVPDVPKVLAPINGEPFINLQIENWLAQGITSFVFILHHDANLIKDYISNLYPKLIKNKKIQFVIESQPLDTGGAVSNAIHELNLNSNFLVTNADTWLSTGFKMMWNSKAPSIAVTKVSDISRFGKVCFEDDKVISFEEKNNICEPGYINAGIFLFHPSDFETQTNKIFSLERSLLVELVNKNKLNIVKLNTYFIDIGVPSDYNRFCRWIANNKKNKL